MSKITFSDILGKVILVGLTYYSDEDTIVNLEQYYGTVIESGKQGICIKLNDGMIKKLPPDLSSINAAPSGEYRLKSTGEIVVNPDFLSTWNVMIPNEDKK